MNDITLLTAAVVQNPRNDILAAMLTDELMGAKDMLRAEANKHVENVQLTADHARQMDAAAAVLGGKGRYAQGLRYDIIDIVGADHQFPPFIFIVPGPDGPCISYRPSDTSAAYWGNSIVTVGALWCLLWASEYHDMLSEIAKASAAKRKKK